MNDDTQPQDERNASAAREDKRGGSETRQRKRLVAIRMTADEHSRVHDRAEKAGLSTGAFIRHQALGDAGPRARKQAPADRKELVRLLGAVNRVGNNLNQIAHALNAKQGFHPTALDAGMDELREAIRDIRAALGREPSGEDDGLLNG